MVVMSNFLSLNDFIILYSDTLGHLKFNLDMDVDYDYSLSCFKFICNGYPDFFVKKALNFYNARKMRKLRCRNRIKKIIDKGCGLSFLTLTFNDKYLLDIVPKCIYKKTDPIKYLSRVARSFVKSQCNAFVGNVDFGELNGRIHFHFVVGSDFIDVSKWEKFGFAYNKRAFSKDSKIFTDYLFKSCDILVNHAFKDSVLNNYLIYSRG